MVSMSLRRQALGLVVVLVVCCAVAAAGAAMTNPKIDTWYAGLVKPPWTPPNWVFAPVWSLLYLCMAIAAWLVWRQDGLWAAAEPLGKFGAQLLLNLAWSGLFFGLERPGAALVDVLLLLLAIDATMASFWRRSAAAGLLLVPYLIWASFASILNLAIWRLN
jgi:translocator protein